MSLHGLGTRNSLLDHATTHPDSDKITENYNSHHEALLSMQRQQQEELLRQQTNQLDHHTTGAGGVASLDLDHGFISSSSNVMDFGDNGRTHSFTLDSATAQFAVSAVRTKADGLPNNTTIYMAVDAKRRKLDTVGLHMKGAGRGKLISQHKEPVTASTGEHNLYV